MELEVEEAGPRLYVQPIVELASGKPVAAEALLRWHDPQRGLLSPAAFIPAAERSGSIHELGRWVLGQAAALVARGAEEWLSVNVSPWQLQRYEFCAEVGRAVAAARRPGALMLEVTENLRDFDLDELGRVLLQLRAAGARFAIDDCDGSERSWEVLARLPRPDLIKIDRQLFGDATHRPALERFSRWSEEARVDVVAEGLEQPAHVELARACGFRYGQGYHFARPRPAPAP